MSESEANTVVVDEEPDLHDYFCDSCREVVSDPVKHREDVHEDDEYHQYNVLPIKDRGSEENMYIAQERNMGHYTPHIWTENEGMESCGECGAIRFLVAE